MSPRRAAVLAGGAMLVVYVLTLAPSVTFWDAGEFIAAARVLGIPHPPGTPLFVVLLNAWAKLFPFLPFAVATNLFSAVCTSAAVALTAWWIGRATSSGWLPFAAMTAGAMTSVWQNATETEVYAASLALSVATLVAADAAGRSGERRWLVLSAYLIALCVPLHLSALVSAPAAIYLAARRENGGVQAHAVLLLTGAAAASFAVGRLSIPWALASVALFLASAFIARRARTSDVVRAPRDWLSPRAAVATAIALCAVFVLLVRARLDPPINQGNPSTLSALGDVIARRQYAVAGLWPRQAPVWLQLANWFEYADWQFALSLGASVVPTVARVAATIVFAALGVAGARFHRELDRRTWIGAVILFLSGSLGVLVYLNLKAGSSFAWNFVPSAAAHEARDRDYFFVLGFWVWGVWAGLGAFAVARRMRWPAAAALPVVALPIALNWTAVTRREEPEASLPREVASALLDPVPPNAVLFVDGDNDTYPLWFAQQVEGRRRDVTVVTLPLLAASWYVDELARRDGLAITTLPGDFELGTSVTLSIGREVARAAMGQGRPVAVAITVPAAERNRLNSKWKVIGLHSLAEGGAKQSGGGRIADSVVVTVDTQEVARAMASIEVWRRGRQARSAVDPVNDDFLQALSCPSLILGKTAKPLALASLDSTCNLR